MKAVLFDKIGSPSEVLFLGEIEQPEIGENNVLIRMVASSINPGDFLFIQNLYPEPKKPVFPRQIGGNHGAGIVVKGGGNTTVKAGTFVAFSYLNTWAEYAVVPEEFLIELPADYPVEKAAQFVNLVTAWDLVAAAQVGPGGWLTVTAGNSAVSLMTIQFARRKNINVISIVRSIQPGLDADAIGPLALIDLSKLEIPLQDKIREITGGKGVSGIVDSVGGPILAQLIKSIAFKGKVIICGGQSDESYSLHNFDFLLNGLEIRPYVYRYFFDPPRPEEKDMLAEIITVSSETGFYTPIGGTFELDNYQEAIRNAIENPSSGKTLFTFEHEADNKRRDV